jgi:hypothetical protein
MYYFIRKRFMSAFNRKEMFEVALPGRNSIRGLFVGNFVGGSPQLAGQQIRKVLKTQNNFAQFHEYTLSQRGASWNTLSNLATHWAAD